MKKNYFLIGLGLTAMLFSSKAASAQTQIDLPVTFDVSTVNYTMTDFGGNASLLVADPTLATNNVMQVIKTGGAQTWAGTTVSTPAGLANPIPFTATEKRMSVRVWSPYAGKTVRLKVENADTNTIFCEADVVTTVAGAWDTLVFDFATPAGGGVNLSKIYNMASIFFDFNTAGAQDTFYFDDVEFGSAVVGPPPPPVRAQIDFPVTFEDTSVNYTMTDFGGNVSVLVTDPTNSMNHVMEVEKTAGSQTWAGTTIGTASGFATPLPFASGSTIMSVKVWSPNAGTTVRLKVENADTATISCETDAVTTATAGWQILNFDFSNEAAGTAALNFSKIYNKASIFFDFNVAGAGDTYYFDDVRWGQASLSVSEFSANSIKVYPNPSNGILTISTDDYDVEGIEILSIDGKIVYSNNKVSNRTTIDITNFEKGVYILNTIIDGTKVSKKIIKN